VLLPFDVEINMYKKKQTTTHNSDPLPGGAGRLKFNQLETVTTFTYIRSLVKIDACNFELSWQQTHKQTCPQTGPITTHCAAASAECKNSQLIAGG